MNKYTMVLALVAAGVVSGCASQTKVVAENIVLGKEMLVVPLESPWKSERTALRLCVAPSKAYSRKMKEGTFQGVFVNEAGEVISIYGHLFASDGAQSSWDPSMFYLQTNLACFSVHPSFSTNYARVGINASSELSVDKVFWEWAYIH